MHDARFVCADLVVQQSALVGALAAMGDAEGGLDLPGPPMLPGHKHQPRVRVGQDGGRLRLGCARVGGQCDVHANSGDVVVCIQWHPAIMDRSSSSSLRFRSMTSAMALEDDLDME